MRGPFADAIATTGHRSAYFRGCDRQQPESAAQCGACHAVTNGHGLEVERTIDEWRTTSYAQPTTLRTCGRCHMAETAGVAAQVPGAPTRPVHDHSMPGLDFIAGSSEGQQLVARFLDPAISAKLCVVPGQDAAVITVTVDNALVGHAWPSGATQNRRAWLEIVAYAGGLPVYSSGSVRDGESVTASSNAPALLLSEQLYDALGETTPFMWNAQTVRSELLTPATGNDPADSTRSVVASVATNIDRVTAIVHVRPVDYDVVDALIASGDLPRSQRGIVTTLTVAATRLEWTWDRGPACLP
jgi:hypothetical protein